MIGVFSPSLFHISLSSLTLVRLFTRGHHSPTEYLLTASLFFCWSMFCMQWCLKFCAIAATHSQPSSSGQQQKRRPNDSRKKENNKGVKDALLRGWSTCKLLLRGLELLAVAIFGGEIGSEGVFSFILLWKWESIFDIFCKYDIHQC